MAFVQKMWNKWVKPIVINQQVQVYLLDENIKKLMIIAIVGAIVNLGVTWVSLFDYNASLFIKLEIYLRMMWVLLSLVYCIGIYKIGMRGNDKQKKQLFYVTLSMSLVLAALVSSLPFADNSYAIVYIANVLFIGTFLYLSIKEMLMVFIPSAVVLTLVYFVYPNALLHQEGNLVNVIAITLFSFAISMSNFNAKVIHFNDLKTIELQNEKLYVMSTQDELTGIANRRGINETLDFMRRENRAKKDSLGVLMIDIDYFKRYNDLYGHIKGDQCLTEIAKLIHGTCEKNGFFVGRYGGEEFLVLLPSTSYKTISEFAELLCDLVCSQAFPHDDSPEKVVTISIGGFWCGSIEKVQEDKYIESADRALYIAKNKGRNCFEILENQ